MRRLAGLVFVFWPATALACPYCAQDRGAAAYLIVAVSLLPLLLAGAVGWYAWRIVGASEPEEPKA